MLPTVPQQGPRRWIPWHATCPHYPDLVANVLSVNLARVRANPDAPSISTGIDKAAVHEAVMVRSPGPMRGGLGSGLVGDTIGNHKVHGGDDQAVYAYAREDLDGWETQLARKLTNGMFGENLTTTDVDVTGARIGERWRSVPMDWCSKSPRPVFPAAPFRPSYNWITGSRPSPRRRNPEPICGLSHRERCGPGTRLARLPPRSRCDHRRCIPRPDVRIGPASAVVAGRRAPVELKDYARDGLRRTSRRLVGVLGRCRRRCGGIRTAVSRCGDIARNGLRSAARPAQVFRRLDPSRGLNPPPGRDPTPGLKVKSWGHYHYDGYLAG